MSNDPNWPPSHEQLPKNMSNTTNDPEQKYGEREPMLSDVEISKMSVTDNGFAGENKYRMSRRVRDHYESLITDGTLIRRDELVKFLNERLLDEEKGVRWNMHNDGSAVTVVQNIIDHINKSR